MVDAPDIELPDWLHDLRDLRPYVDELEDFAEGPTEYVLEIVLTRFVNWMLTGAEIVIGAIQTALSPLVDVPQTIADPLLAGGGAISGALAGVIGTLNDAIVSVSTAAGPAGPLVVIVIWGVIFIAAAEMVRRGLQSLPLVVPWL